MSMLSRESWPSGWRAAAADGRAKAAAGAAVVGLGALIVHQLPLRATTPVAAESPPTSLAQRLDLERCIEGAVLRHDVRWAAVCMVLAQQDEARHVACLADPAIVGHPELGRGYCDRTFPLGDGSAECELPNARAGSLYDLLQREEQRCLAEAAGRRR
jgi:hypothetical protein